MSTDLFNVLGLFNSLAIPSFVSTISGYFLSVCLDWYRKQYNPGRQEYIRVARIMTVVISVITALIPFAIEIYSIFMASNPLLKGRGAYGVLGTSVDSDTRSISKKYRELSRQFHPDKASPADAAQFEVISLANSILKDGPRRLMYDKMGLPDLVLHWKFNDESPPPLSQFFMSKVFDALVAHGSPALLSGIWILFGVPSLWLSRSIIVASTFALEIYILTADKNVLFLPDFQTIRLVRALLSGALSLASLFLQEPGTPVVDEITKLAAIATRSAEVANYDLRNATRPFSDDARKLTLINERIIDDLNYTEYLRTNNDSREVYNAAIQVASHKTGSTQAKQTTANKRKN